MKNMNTYAIQAWLFKEAAGKFNIDLAESGIQYHHLNDLKITENYDLNYSIDRGHPALCELIASLYGVDSSNVIVTHGSQEALYLFYCCQLDTNDHVITFSPGWQQSWEVPRQLGANVTVLALRKDHQFQIDIDQLQRAITPNTRLIILNSPNNPTGQRISSTLLAQLIDLCDKHNIFLLNDEEYLTDYHDSIYKKYFHAAGASSLSKVYGFPGLRIGWLVGPTDIIDKMVNYKRYITVTNASLCEYLALQILQKSQRYLDEYQTLLSDRFAVFKKFISLVTDMRLIVPQNTPFAYLGLPDHIHSWEFSRSLLEHHKVLVMPSEVFQDTHAIRVSFVRQRDILQSGLNKICQHYEYFSKVSA